MSEGRAKALKCYPIRPGRVKKIVMDTPVAGKTAFMGTLVGPVGMPVILIPDYLSYKKKIFK